MSVCVRFAPSPTGYLHVGGAHTALFNWLFARRQGGCFRLRIEDTDLARSTPEMVNPIFEGLRWLELDWDGEVVYQSRRMERYRQAVQTLLEQGKAYYCYCTPEALAQRRAATQAAGQTWRYDRRCLELSESERARYVAEGRPAGVRLLVPERKIRFTDLVYGDIEVDSTHLDDFFIARSDGSPLYHLAVVVDDVDMAISHVIRGADHISNTWKHILLFEGLAAPLPRFAHLPMILGPDKRKLSKRHGAAALSEYREQGFLADAMVNFLALLGWSPGDDREFLSRAQLISEFSLERVNKRDTIFDMHKLNWLNGQHINALSDARLIQTVHPLLVKAGLIEENLTAERRAWLMRVLQLLKERVRTMDDFAAWGRFFFVAEIEYNPKAVRKHWKNPEAVAERLRAVREQLAELETFSIEQIEQGVRLLAETHQVKPALFIHPIRVALTGQMVGPGLFELMAVLGRQRVLERLDRACDYLRSYQHSVVSR